MVYKVNDLMYAASEELANNIRTDITFNEPVNEKLLCMAVNTAIKRFPYFAVKLVRNGEDYVMEHNTEPLVITCGTVGAALGSAENNFHLFSVTYDTDTVHVYTSHYITDGNGLFPFIRTMSYLYFHELYPDEGFDTENIALPDSTIPSLEATDDPYPAEPLPCEPVVDTKRPQEILKLNDLLEARDKEKVCTSLRLNIQTKEMMNYISSVDGSPATFVASLMYKTISDLHPESHLPVVCGMQHQFRKALGNPYSHMCHVNIVPMVYPDRLRKRGIEMLNTMSRGMLMLRASSENDMLTVNAHIENSKKLAGMTLGEKHEIMRQVVKDGIGENTFEVSYTGRVPWCGLEKHIRSAAPYIDLSLSGGLSIEIFSVGDRFDINIMQWGSSRRYFEHFCRLLSECGIKFTAKTPFSFELCGISLPT